MNAWIQSLGLDTLKPLLVALLLPPVPLLLLTLLGALLLRRRPLAGWTLVLASVSLQWTLWTSAGADAVAEALLDLPLPIRQPLALKQQPPARGQQVIVVLGGGRTAGAEYHEVSLNPLSMERLRYGVWLSRETGFPLAFSGGVGPGFIGPSEGSIALRIARDEFRHPLRWMEDRSRDTHENALRTIEMLRDQGVGRLIVVTHDLHLPRAIRHFERARDAAGLPMEVVPAPVGITERGPERLFGDYLPSPQGIARSRYALREWLGLKAGA